MPLSTRSSESPVFPRSSILWDKASPLTHQKTCLSIPLSGKDLGQGGLQQLKIPFWCYEDEVYLCDCLSSPPGRLMSWIIYCGHKFGGTVFTCFWVTGDVASPWVWLDHYDRSLSSPGTTELQKGIMASRRLFENWARRKLFPSAFSNVNEFNAKSPETGLVYLVWLQNPVLNWAVRPLLWWIRLSPLSLPLQGREVRHLVLRTSSEQGLCFSCWKLESWEFPDFGGRVRSKREVSGISKLFCFSP